MSIAAVKNPKDVLFVNFQEIPETICVETRFVTQMIAKQKPSEYVFYVTNKNGNLELTRQDQLTVLKKSMDVSKPAALTLSIQPKPTGQLERILKNQTRPSPLGSLATAITNLSKQEGNITGGNKNMSTNSAAEKNIIPTVSIPLNNINQLQNYSPIMPKTLTATANALNVINKRKYNDQAQQTEVSTMKDIAIQCKLDEEELDSIGDESLPITEAYVENGASSETEVMEFLQFIQKNSVKYKTHRECLICGEVSKSSKFFYGHMAVHRGTKTMCHKCGRQFEDQLLPKHNCRRAKQLEKAFLQCPHHGCGVVALSRMELYDHINEHNDIRMYKCNACRKGFCTGQEYLRHLLIRPNCYTSARSRRFRIYGLESRNDRLCRVRVFTLHMFKECTTLVKSFLSQRVTKKKVCKICLRSYTNTSTFNHHRKKCLRKFRKRLMRKRNRKESTK